MRMIVVYGSDPRKRYRFVLEPLLMCGCDAESFHLASLGDFFNIIRKIKNYDVILAVGLGPKLFFLFLASLLLKVPFVVRLGGDVIRDTRSMLLASFPKRPFLFLRMGMLNICARIFLRLIKFVIVVNSDLANKIRPRLRRAAKMVVISQYAPSDVEEKDQAIYDTPKILSVTNLNYKSKYLGLVWIVNGLSKFVEENNTGIEFRIAGGGIHLQDLKCHIQELQIPCLLKISVLGHVDNIANEFKHANLFLYKSDHDGTPNVLLEALRWQTPILVNDFPAFFEIIEDDRSGFFYKDSDSFCQKLGLLLNDKEVRERLILSATKDYLKRYGCEAIGGELLRFLKLVLTSGMH